GLVCAAGIEDGGHVANGLFFRVGAGVIGRVALAVPPHVPHDHAVLRGEVLHLPPPHLRGGGVSVAEEDGPPFAVRLVEDLDTVALDERHADSFAPRRRHASPVVVPRRACPQPLSGPRPAVRPSPPAPHAMPRPRPPMPT